MGDVKDFILIEGLKGPKKVEVLFDTGADIGHITRHLAEELDLPVTYKDQQFRLGDGSKIKADLVAAVVEIKNCRFPAWFVLVDEEERPTIGLRTMQSMGIELDPQNKSYTVRCNIPKL